MKKTEIQKMDMISELPEPILHHILSFLHFKEVARTCVLSKKWERVWLMYPVVEINNCLFKSCYHYEKEVFRRRRLKLLDTIEKGLRNRHRHCKDLLSMEKFTIAMKLLEDREFAPFVDRCVSYAIGCNVKKLRLGFGLDDYNDDDDDDYDYDEFERERRYYNLPPIVFCAKSIEVLKLGRCKVGLPIGSDVKLSYLRKLHLIEVDINSYAINNLFAGCPLIEEMIICECDGFEYIELFCLSRINNITMINNWNFSRVDVKLLNVSSLTICDEEKFRQYDINVTDCSNLKDIELMGASIKDESLYKLISELPLLENLCLASCGKLERVMISSPSLKTLKISKCYEIVELKIDSPNLSNFTFDGGMISLCSNALALSNIDLYLKKFDNQIQWYVKLIELLTQFHSFSGTLKLLVAKDEDFNIPKEWRQMLPSPSSGGMHFRLLINKISLPVSVAKVVFDLLWIAPHTKTVSIEYLNSSSWRNFFFEFSYKKPVVYEGEASSCFKSHPISYWLHCIEEVKLEFANSDGIGIKRCSLKGVEFLERLMVLHTQKYDEVSLI